MLENRTDFRIEIIIMSVIINYSVRQTNSLYVPFIMFLTLYQLLDINERRSDNRRSHAHHFKGLFHGMSGSGQVAKAGICLPLWETGVNLWMDACSKVYFVTHFW